jgi:hypothetical protein
MQSDAIGLTCPQLWLTFFLLLPLIPPVIERTVASDKCIGESECLTFDQHMQITSDMWKRHQGATGITDDPTVVFTTESTSMLKEQQTFVADNGEAKYPFKFDFVTNTQDITPDSGFMKDIGTCSACKSSAVSCSCQKASLAMKAKPN